MRQEMKQVSLNHVYMLVCAVCINFGDVFHGVFCDFILVSLWSLAIWAEEEVGGGGFW